MVLTVLVFAEIKKKLQCDRIFISTDLPILVEDLLFLIIKLKPELKGLIQTCAVAANGQVVEKNTFIYSTDEIALLPPVSGG